MIAALGDDFPIPPEFIAAFRDKGIPVLRSPERALRALAHATAYGRTLARRRDGCGADRRPAPAADAARWPEYEGKTYLAALGIAVPEGALARDIDARRKRSRRASAIRSR